MSAAVIGLTIFAAVLHATWNAALRSGVDRLWFVTVMSFATTFAAIPYALLLPLPATQSWTYLGISAVLQVLYSIFLAHAYRYGELGQVFPIVRCSVPLMVTIGGFVLAGQRVSRPELFGVTLICPWSMSLPFCRTRAGGKTGVLAPATAAFVARYLSPARTRGRVAGKTPSHASPIFPSY